MLGSKEMGCCSWLEEITTKCGWWWNGSRDTSENKKNYRKFGKTCCCHSVMFNWPWQSRVALWLTSIHLDLACLRSAKIVKRLAYTTYCIQLVLIPKSHDLAGKLDRYVVLPAETLKLSYELQTCPQHEVHMSTECLRLKIYVQPSNLVSMSEGPLPSSDRRSCRAPNKLEHAMM